MSGWQITVEPSGMGYHYWASDTGVLWASGWLRGSADHARASALAIGRAAAAGAAVLPPRAVSALCALRCCPLAVLDLCVCVGDASPAQTQELLVDLIDYISHVPGDSRSYLTARGVAWLEAHGLHAAPGAVLP